MVQDAAEEETRATARALGREPSRSRILSRFFECFRLPSCGEAAIVLAEQRPRIYRACNTPPHQEKRRSRFNGSKTVEQVKDRRISCGEDRNVAQVGNSIF